MYAKVETERLNYIRNHQTKLRVENYIHLRDAMCRADSEVSDMGQMVVLPSSFTGGPRYMDERTQDAMTMFVNMIALNFLSHLHVIQNGTMCKMYFYMVRNLRIGKTFLHASFI